MKLEGVRQKVFLDRYSLKDKEGNPIEQTPVEMWKRIAKGISAVEKKEVRKKWEDTFYKSMEDFKFVPGGRVLAGAGTGYGVTFYNCLPPDQEILTPQGYRPIKEIKVGDMVITGKKRARKVKQVFIREAEELLYTIKPIKLGFDEVRLTGEHPVLAIKKEWVNTHRDRDGLRLKSKPQWIKANDLSTGDFVGVAWNSEIKKVSKINLKHYLPDSFKIQNGFIVKSQLKKPVKDEIEVDEKLMLLFGSWLGDGYVTHRTGTDIPTGIQITFNKKQKEWADEIAFILQEKFQVAPTVNVDRWGQQLIQVRVESYPVGLFFKNFLGTYSFKKKIPQVLMEQPTESILPLIKGMFRADGYISKNSIGIALSNRYLATQLHELILRTGRFFTIFENTHRKGRHKTYRVTGGISQANGLCEYIFGEKKESTHHDQDYFLVHDNLFWARIESIKKTPYKGKVYDIEVDEDHSFITGGVVVSNCFVIPSPEDSRDGILDNLKAMIEIMARGGGVGVNISSLRPRGARVKKVNGFSSGPINWAGMYSLATHDIIQQGGSRRGALMVMLWDWHPDIEEFITVKQDLTKINGANLSVCASDAFMEAVKNDSDWDLVFPDIDDPEYDEKWDGILPHWKALGKKVKVYKTIKARYLWNLICAAAWRSAEPGLVFMERYNKWYNNWYWNTINCVNPCGEEGLPAWGVCNLASLNLSAFVKGYEVDKPGEFDYEELARHARIAVRFQDDVVDADQYIFPEIKKMQKEGERRIGLGTLGLADALIKMHLRYGSEEAVSVIDKIYKTIRDVAYDESVNLAKEKGPFPKINIKKHLQGYFIQQLPEEIKEKIKKYGIRNSMLLQAAPTGTTSLLSAASSGIEPVYEFEYYHTGRLGRQLVYHNLYGQWKKTHPNEKRPDYFVAANDLTPEDHVRVQATVQKYVDASISKTVNAPNSHTVEDVKKLYMLAYDLGCKGITYMRDGSRQAILERVSEKKEEAQVSTVVQKTPSDPFMPRPMVVEGVTYQAESPVGKTYVTINHHEGKPFEVFITNGKSGSDVAAMADALGRIISIFLRINSPVAARERLRKIVSELSGLGGARSVGFGENKVRSLPDAVAKVVAKYCGFRVNGAVEDKPLATPVSGNGLNGHRNGLTQPTNGQADGHGTSLDLPIIADDKPSVEQLAIGEGNMTAASSTTGLFDLCPECGAGSLAYEEGCQKCYSCGYSAC